MGRSGTWPAVDIASPNRGDEPGNFGNVITNRPSQGYHVTGVIDVPGQIVLHGYALENLSSRYACLSAYAGRSVKKTPSLSPRVWFLGHRHRWLCAGRRTDTMITYLSVRRGRDLNSRTLSIDPSLWWIARCHHGFHMGSNLLDQAF